MVKDLRKIKFVIALIVLLIANVHSQDEFKLQEGTIVKLIDDDRAKELLMTPDDYTAVLSKFDLQSKTNKTDNVTPDDYFKYSSEQVLKWSPEESKAMGVVIESIGSKIKTLGLHINMPDTIQIIKSTMANEGEADGYTRGTYIVLKDKNVGNKPGSLNGLVTHELFHVLSRYDKEMSERVYNTLGFKKCNEVAYPPQIADLRISNPDAPFNNFYITVKNNGKPVEAMLILYASKPYSGGSFFMYMQIGLLVVTGDEGNKSPVYEDGKPVILKLNEVDNFYGQVGKNTGYVIHAEEICADHFVMLLDGDKDLPNPELIEAMKDAMK